MVIGSPEMDLHKCSVGLLKQSLRSEERRVGKECRYGKRRDDSSRRRHTRYIGDWSSDVCSSDLGIDAEHPKYGIVGYFTNASERKEFEREVKKVAPQTNPSNGNWIPGNGPSQVFRWAAKAIAKIGRASCRERV